MDRLSLYQINISREKQTDNGAIIWCKVINRAIGDLYIYGRKHPHNSLNWFLSIDESIGSFLWICHNYGLPSVKIINKLEPRIYKLLTYKEQDKNSIKNRQLQQLKRLSS